MAGLGARLGVTVALPLSFDGEMSHDFEQAFTGGFEN
jgi:hypothetical protein